MKEEKIKDLILGAFIYASKIYYNFMVKIFKIKHNKTHL